jgi:predicted N-formylglutamate amidohydrolase
MKTACVESGFGLLGADEPPPLTEWGCEARSSFVIVVDHASPNIPRRLKNLGLAPAELERHIAWDIGSLAVAKQVAAELDARLIAQNYSRLVIYCNRDPGVDSSIVTVSEWTEIPGNRNLSTAEIAARRSAIFEPYHDHLRTVLDERAVAGRATILVAQHSMTDEFKGQRRAMHAAVLYNRDRRFAALVLDQLRAEPTLTVADNEPYRVSDATDYTIPRHAEARGLPHVEIEIRQDLIRDATGQRDWAHRIAGALRQAERVLTGASR